MTGRGSVRGAWVVVVAGFMASGTYAATGRSGEQVYDQLCSTCHEHGNVPRAPHRFEFAMLGPRAVLAALENGSMREQGLPLSADERRAVAEFVGQSTLTQNQAAPVKMCGTGQSHFNLSRPPPLDGWSMSGGGSRYVEPKVARLRGDQISRLRLKWAFAFPLATRARSQPTVGAGALYVGSQDGTVYALDGETGCARWLFKADAEVRSGPTLEPWRAGDRNAQPRLFFGDFNGSAYAIDAKSGRLLWKTLVDKQPRLLLTGSVRYFEGRVYVPMSSNEWASAGDPSYACCTFRGGIVALDAATGGILWRSYAIPQEPKLTGQQNALGGVRYSPAGAPIWNMPTIDAKRRRLYVGTGEGYTSPAAPQTDSIIAFDLTSGGLLWSYQSIADDAWNLACFLGGGPNCPLQNGPDWDFGAPPILHRLPDGRDVLLAGEKSSDVLALDPENGKLLWKRRLGRGGYYGGVHWGMAASPTTLYAPLAETTVLGTEGGTPNPGLFALDPQTGATKWFVTAPDVCAPESKPQCDRGFSAPPTAIDGAVFAGALDGWLRAYDERNGRLLWAFNTLQDIHTISGDVAHGGAIESAGPVVVGGNVIVNSGYLYGGRLGGNLLLVFSVDGR